MGKKGMIQILLMAMCVLLLGGIVFAFPGDIGADASKATQLQGPASVILSYIQYLGYAIAIGMLLYIGIKYMMSAANERAELKKGAVNWVIGAILVAGVTAIVSAVIGIGNQINGLPTGRREEFEKTGLPKSNYEQWQQVTYGEVIDHY